MPPKAPPAGAAAAPAAAKAKAKAAAIAAKAKAKAQAKAFAQLAATVAALQNTMGQLQQENQDLQVQVAAQAAAQNAPPPEALVEGQTRQDWVTHYNGGPPVAKLDAEGRPTDEFIEMCRRVGPGLVHQVTAAGVTAMWPEDEHKRLTECPAALGILIGNGISSTQEFMATTEHYESRPIPHKSPLRWPPATTAGVREAVCTLWFEVGMQRARSSALDSEMSASHWRGVSREKTKRLLKKISESRSLEIAISALRAAARACFLRTNARETDGMQRTLPGQILRAIQMAKTSPSGVSRQPGKRPRTSCRETR